MAALCTMWLNAGVDINSREKENEVTPLFKAAGAGSMNAANILLKAAGVDKSAQGRDGNTPLHAAAAGSYGDMVALLLENGADPTVLNNLEETPLHLLARARGLKKGDRFAISTALKGQHRDALDILDRQGLAPLHCAVDADLPENVQMLLLGGADASVMAEGGVEGSKTPLTLACEGKKLECVRLLAEGGADTNAATADGKTALMAAILAGSGDAAGFALGADADLDMADKDGRTALHLAVEAGNLGLVKMLVEVARTFSPRPTRETRACGWRCGRARRTLCLSSSARA